MMLATNFAKQVKNIQKAADQTQYPQLSSTSGNKGLAQAKVAWSKEISPWLLGRPGPRQRSSPRSHPRNHSVRGSPYKPVSSRAAGAIRCCSEVHHFLWNRALLPVHHLKHCQQRHGIEPHQKVCSLAHKSLNKNPACNSQSGHGPACR